MSALEGPEQCLYLTNRKTEAPRGPLVKMMLLLVAGHESQLLAPSETSVALSVFPAPFPTQTWPLPLCVFPVSVVGVLGH